MLLRPGRSHLVGALPRNKPSAQARRLARAAAGCRHRLQTGCVQAPLSAGGPETQLPDHRAEGEAASSAALHRARASQHPSRRRARPAPLGQSPAVATPAAAAAVRARPGRRRRAPLQPAPPVPDPPAWEEIEARRRARELPQPAGIGTFARKMAKLGATRENWRQARPSARLCPAAHLRQRRQRRGSTLEAPA